MGELWDAFQIMFSVVPMYGGLFVGLIFQQIYPLATVPIIVGGGAISGIWLAFILYFNKLRSFNYKYIRMRVESIPRSVGGLMRKYWGFHTSQMILYKDAKVEVHYDLKDAQHPQGKDWAVARVPTERGGFRHPVYNSRRPVPFIYLFWRPSIHGMWEEMMADEIDIVMFSGTPVIGHPYVHNIVVRELVSATVDASVPPERRNKGIEYYKMLSMVPISEVVDMGHGVNVLCDIACFVVERAPGTVRMIAEQEDRIFRAMQTIFAPQAEITA